MNADSKQVYKYFILGAALLFVVQNWWMIYSALRNIFHISTPVLLGLVIAFVIHVPVKMVKNLLTKLLQKFKISPKDGILTVASLLITLLAAVIILILVAAFVIPNILDSFRTIYFTLTEKVPLWISFLEENILPPESDMFAWLDDFDVSLLLSKLDESGFLNSIRNFSSTLASKLSNLGIASVIAIYLILSKDKVCRSTKRFTYAVFKPRFADFLCHVASLINQTYSKFFSGQLLESCILGCLMFCSLSLFRIPYAGVTAFLTALCAFVPYIGAFLSCCIGVLMVLLVDPPKALLCIIVYMVTQFIENQFIYPHVVGTSVGLPALLTLIAVIVGNKLFGIVGMIFAIPVMAVLYTLMQEFITERLRKKDISVL